MVTVILRRRKPITGASPLCNGFLHFLKCFCGIIFVCLSHVILMRIKSVVENSELEKKSFRSVHFLEEYFQFSEVWAKTITVDFF